MGSNPTFSANGKIFTIRWVFFCLNSRVGFEQFLKIVLFSILKHYIVRITGYNCFIERKTTMKIRMENILPMKIAYIRQTGPYGTNNALAMEKLKDWANSNHLLNDQSIILGIARDNPNMTKPEDCRYDVCLIVSGDETVYNQLNHDDYINSGDIIGGSYAVFQIDHTVEAVQNAWSEIFPELLKQGWQFDVTKPILERYQAQMVKEHSCEICVPINFL